MWLRRLLLRIEQGWEAGRRDGKERGAHKSDEAERRVGAAAGEWPSKVEPVSRINPRRGLRASKVLSTS